MVETSNDEGYALSFTAATARQADMLVLARCYLACNDWQEVLRQVREDNILGYNRPASAVRVAQELIKRLRTLSQEELAFFGRSVDDDTHAMLWVSICRTYPFLRDLSEQLVAGRWNNMMGNLPVQAVDAFMDEQKHEHERLARTTESTQSKLRSTSLTMLRECKLRTRDGTITPLYPSAEFVELVRANHPEDLALFPRVGALL